MFHDLPYNIIDKEEKYRIFDIFFVICHIKEVLNNYLLLFVFEKIKCPLIYIDMDARMKSNQY